MNRETGKKRRDGRDDLELVRRFQAGDTTAFDELVLRHADTVFSLCCRILGDYDDANDCAQDVFIKAFRGLKGFAFRSGFSTWLHTVAVNTCRNHMTSLQYRTSVRMVRLDSPADPEGGTTDIRDASYDPEKQYERKERDVIIQQALGSLPEKQRILVVLRDIEGKSYEEMVRITGMKLGTVKSKLLRARQSLRELLKGVI